MFESSGRSWKVQEVGKVNLPTSLSNLNGNFPASDFSLFQTAFSDKAFPTTGISYQVSKMM